MGFNSAFKGLKKILRVSNLSSKAKHYRRHTSETILFSTTSDRGLSPRLPTERSSRYAERRGTGIHWWFVLDGAPAHILPAVRQFSNSLFPEHRTGRCGAHHHDNICSLPFVLQQSASPGLATADIECGSRGFTASQATYCDEQFTGRCSVLPK